MGEKTFKGFGW